VAKFAYIWLDNISYMHDNLREELRIGAKENNIPIEGLFFEEVDS